MPESKINRRSLLLAAPAAGVAAVVAPAVVLARSPVDRLDAAATEMVAAMAPYRRPETSRW